MKRVSTLTNTFSGKSTEKWKKNKIIKTYDRGCGTFIGSRLDLKDNLELMK